MRWLLLIVAIVGLLGSWWSASPFWFGTGLVVGVVAAVAAALAFAQARIDDSAQPEIMADPEIEALKSAVRENRKKNPKGVSSGKG